MSETRSCKPDTTPSAEKKSSKAKFAINTFLAVDRLVRIFRWVEKHYEPVSDWLTNL